MEKNEKKEIKISLKTVVFLVIVVAILMGVLFMAIDKTINTKVNVKEKEVGQEEEKPELPEQPEEPNVDVSNSDFELKFLKLENNGKNMVYSPLSINYALSMLKEGADGETKEQIEKVIGDRTLTKYDNIDENLAFANGLFIRDTFSEYVKENYMEVLRERYNAEINNDSFKNAKIINKWIEDKTLGIIKDLLKDEVVQNPENVMILINALAIDMEWVVSFDPANTHGSEFYCEDGTVIDATTMNLEVKKDSVAYYMDDKVTALSMDLKEYEDVQLEFVAIMHEEDLSKYVENLEMEDLNNILDERILASETKKGLDISMPRFSFEYELKLKEDLKKLGIINIFDGKLADFSKISDEALYVSDAIHLADIDFTEDGVKAAAVTVIYLTCGVAVEDEKPIEININKPFLYVIRDKNTEEIWFVGTVYEPNLWEEDKENYEYR